MVNKTSRWLTQVGSWEVPFMVNKPVGELESRVFIYTNFH